MRDWRAKERKDMGGIVDCDFNEEFYEQKLKNNFENSERLSIFALPFFE